MPKKILAIDDDPGMLELISFTLKSAGFEVHTRDNGAVALAAIRSIKPDALVLDVMLPGINGYELGVKIAQDPSMQKIPIVVLTSMAGSRSKFLALPQVIGFLTKPLKAEELVELLTVATAKL